MPAEAPLRRVVYALLGAIPASILLNAILPQWIPPHRRRVLDASDAYVLAQSVSAALGTLALWAVVLIPPHQQSAIIGWAIFLGVIAGLLAMGSLFIQLACHGWHNVWGQLTLGDLYGLWLFLGPVIVGVAVLLRTGRASNNRWNGP